MSDIYISTKQGCTCQGTSPKFLSGSVHIYIVSGLIEFLVLFLVQQAIKCQVVELSNTAIHSLVRETKLLGVVIGKASLN